MSVVSRNPYDLLNEDGEEGSRIVPQKTDKKTSTTAKKTEKKVEPKPRSDYPQRGGKRVVPVPRTEARRDYTDRDFSASKQGRGGRSEGTRQGGRGGFGGRGREYDRKSATGKVDSEKKIHQSWGDANTDIQEGEKAALENKGEGRFENQIEKLTIAEPEDPSKTLDEYYAEKTNKLTAKGIALPEARKPNEGVDDTQWKSGVPLEKEDAEYFSTASNKKSKAKKEKKDKVYVGIEQRFTDTRSKHGYEGRSGRGGRNSGVNVHDKSAFPSLG
ncbi:hypothetical protein K7432_005824 [Basidiobolus ranarum]|uniref:Hyaluronan/mRNA-binding protein domain-containing protein n=1 Tax=Basidiobolus ranarum TaxID=34480 RepID=A0ABR2WVU4_9FUNG